MEELTKCSIRLNKSDLDVIRQHYQDIGYNKLLRHLIHRIADKIREGRADALSEIEREIDDE